MKAYLSASEFIDWEHPAVLRQAQNLASSAGTPMDIGRRCFEFVRDDIEHSWDFARGPVTCRASEVLKHRTGYCYAKSHLLAALLRANSIPAGLCYQRLTIQDDVPPFCLHGLNAVFLDDFGWYRIDARGNKPGISAAFCPPTETLAYPIRTPGEADLPEIWPEPLTLVTNVLTRFETYQDVADNLPDIDVIPIT